MAGTRAATLLEARRFILSMGKYAKALSPAEVVADVKEHVTALAKAYGA
jgi:predicted DNA-binding transcriptional regulator YafY